MMERSSITALFPAAQRAAMDGDFAGNGITIQTSVDHDEVSVTLIHESGQYIRDSASAIAIDRRRCIKFLIVNMMTVLLIAGHPGEQ